MVFVVATDVGKNGCQAVGRNRDVDPRHHVGAVQAIVRRTWEALRPGRLRRKNPKKQE